MSCKFKGSWRWTFEFPEGKYSDGSGSPVFNQHTTLCQDKSSREIDLYCSGSKHYHNLWRGCGCPLHWHHPRSGSQTCDPWAGNNPSWRNSVISAACISEQHSCCQTVPSRGPERARSQEFPRVTMWKLKHCHMRRLCWSPGPLLCLERQTPVLSVSGEQQRWLKFTAAKYCFRTTFRMSVSCLGYFR